MMTFRNYLLLPWKCGGDTNCVTKPEQYSVLYLAQDFMSEQYLYLSLSLSLSYAFDYIVLL